MVPQTRDSSEGALAVRWDRLRSARRKADRKNDIFGELMTKRDY